MSMIATWENAQTQGQHQFQMMALAERVESQQHRIAELEEDFIQLTITQRGKAVGRGTSVTASNDINDICDRSTGLQHRLMEVFGHKSCSIISTRDLLGITELSISSRLKAGDLEGFDNLETLRVRTDSRPPRGLFDDLPEIKNFLLEYKGYCGGKVSVNAVPREINGSENCRVSFGSH